MRVAFGMRLRQAMIPLPTASGHPYFLPLHLPSAPGLIKISHFYRPFSLTKAQPADNHNFIIYSLYSGMQNEFDFFLSERARAGKRKVDVSKTPTHKS